MAQRKFIKQLPVINQTTTLQKFFNATIDQVFQPGQLTNINAYIGDKPSYYNPNTDFYKPEYDAERAFYQLEPTMISNDSSGNEQDLLFYVDLVNQLRYQGALVNNQARLFETDYYSWCPPINLDKLQNYQSYYWLPDGPPIMMLNVPVNTYTGNGTTVTFAAPATLPNSVIDVAVQVNGIPVTDFTYANGIVTMATAPQTTDTIQVWTNGNFQQNINGQQSYTFPGSVTAYAQQELTTSFNETEEVLWDTNTWSTNDSVTWEVEVYLDTETVLYQYPDITLSPAPALVRGMRVDVIDNTFYDNWDVTAFDTTDWDSQLASIVELEEVNDVIVLDLVQQSGKLIRRADPQFWTIERGSVDDNGWSLTNHWYSNQLMFYTGNGYEPTASNRPIIEFDKNLKLYNYGVTHIQDVDFIYDTNTTLWALFNAQMEGKTKAIAGSPQPTVTMGATPMTVGQRILVINSIDTALINQIYIVGIDANNNITLTADVAPALYDIVKQVDLTDPDELQNANIQYWADFLWDEIVWDYTIPPEYVFNGTSWVLAQQYSDNPPLFDLFDNNGVSFSNTATYLDSSFTGSNIFSYELDTTGTVGLDSVLNINPVFNSYGSFEYTNNINTDIITSTAGTYGGLKYFANINLDSNNNVTFDYETDWRYAGQTSQTVDPTTGFYNIPQNLQANPDNDDITQISINEWYPQFQQIIAANNWLYPSNFRTVNMGTNIVQNQGTLLKTMLLAANSNLDMMKTFLYVSREYSRYRAKLVQYLTTMYNASAISTVPSALTTALNYLKVTKTSAFAFFNNGMGGGNNYIPASGAYLGLTPLWVPELLLQVSGTTTYLLLRGHDGSILPGFTQAASTNVQITSSTTLTVDGVSTEIDIRDQIMFAYEQQLYAACDPSLQVARRPQFDITKYTPGKFRTTDYTVAEYTKVATPLFDRWAAQGQKDFRTNKNFNPDNVWTWNYSSLKDLDGGAIPGNWRGIYNYFYDTVRPDTHPWEMLGYTSQPSWWAANYSWTVPAQRAALVTAITTGTVSAPGTTVVIDPTFARAAFSKYIPVDDNGNLLDPFAAGIVLSVGFSDDFSNDWVFGDCGPVEYSWMTSEYTSFIKSEMGYLLKPVRFIDTGWQPLDNETVFPTQSDQWISIEYGRRKHFSEYTVHNEVVNNVAQSVVGVQQWISDFITSNGQNITTTFGNHVRGLGVQLANKVGGFTDSTTIIASTDSQGVLPNDAVNVVLYNSPSVREEFYGGVIVKWTGNGWAVLGYDVLNPVFNILPVNTTGPKVTIALGSMPPPTNPWRSNTFYQAGILVSYQNSVYQCATTHTSGSTFEQQFWTLQAGVSIAIPPSLLFYTKAQVGATAQTVPYGTVFNKAQDLANFLAGYELYLKSRGWVFDSFDSSINAGKDFRLALRQFLNWAQVSWTPGTFITLSPLADGVKFVTAHGAVEPVEQVINGVYAILDRGGQYVDIKSTKVNRLNESITVSSTSTGIFGLRLCVSEVEHCLIFENTTKFNDVIYEPLFNLRQDRIRMNFNVSTNWNGTLNAPGFLITDNLMVPSFDRTVEDVRNMYSIEQPVYSVMRDYARHQIGYQSQSYLADIFNSELNQFEFYQGMIQQKGALASLSALMRNTTLASTTDLEFLEEWAFRVANYGGSQQENVYEFLLTTADVRQDPQRIDVLASTDETLNATELTNLQNVDSLVMQLYSNDEYNDSRWVIPPGNTVSGAPVTTLFPALPDYRTHQNDLPTAGYVRIDEADAMAGTFDLLNAQVEAGTIVIAADDRVWVYDKEDHLVPTTYTDQYGVSQTINALVTCNDWDLLRAMEDSTTGATNTVVQIMGGLGGLDITLFSPTTIAVGEYIYVASPAGTDPDIAGVYRVTAVDGAVVTIDADLNVAVAFTPTTDNNGNLIPNTSAPSVLRLVSLRFYENNSTGLSQVLGVKTSAQRYATALTQQQISAGQIPQLHNAPIPVFESALPDTLPNTFTPYSSFLADGELIYVDVGYIRSTQKNYEASQKRWKVYQWNVVSQTFTVYRSQSPRIHRDRVDSVALYDSITALDNTANTMQANPLLYSGIVSFDPVQNLIPGAATREIWYKQEYDPARYNQGAETALGLEWDATQVGRVWWNLRDTHFLLAETDDLSLATGANYTTEMLYRQNNWGSVAPGSDVELYEWTESTVSPTTWHTNYVAGTDPATYDGDVFNSASPSWVEKQVYDPTVGNFVTMYYFWVLNPTTTPDVEFRTISAASAAQIIEDPATNGIAWMAPIASNSLIVKSLAQFLTPTSAIQLRVRKNDAQVGKHSEWQLLRPNDGTSLPSPALFTDMVYSTVARDALGNAVPNPKLYATAQVGDDLRAGQSWFMSSTNARTHLVEYLNNYFANLLLSDERPYALPVLEKTQSSDQYLQWTQTAGSAYVEPIPNAQVGQPRYATLQAFSDAVTKNPSLTTGLVANLGAATPFWSVMETTGDTNSPFTIASRWTQQVASLAELQALTGLAVGTNILVTANTATANMWTVWQWNGTTFVLVETQRYDTTSIFTIVDWYAAGYDSTMVPSAIYANQSARDIALGATPTTITYILVQNDGAGNWTWQQYSNGVWNVVAKQNGTIQLNSNIYTNTGSILNVTGTKITDFNPTTFAALVNNRDMGLELNVFLNALRDSVMLAVELNQLFFSMVKYVHTEQDFVPWCFKTSFMYIQGFNANLIASPIASVDYTSALLSYIDEVKPYHVKVRDFISQYGLFDTANVHATDFDVPVYYDASLQVYRTLNPLVPADLAILQTGNYADWYNQWKAGNNLVRKFNVTLTFDRVTFDATEPNGLAIDRMAEYWNGDVNSRKDLASVMKGVFFNEAVIRGGNLASPPFNVADLTFAPNTLGQNVATNAPSFVYFAQEFNSTEYVLPSDWDNIPYGGTDTPDTLWDNPNDALDPIDSTWQDMTMLTWEQLLSTDWENLNFTGSQVGIWDAFQFDFNAVTPEFDYNSGHRIEIFRNGSRLSLINKDYIVILDAGDHIDAGAVNPNPLNRWKIYISMDAMQAGDTVVIMLVKADTPEATLCGGAMTTADSAYQAIINGSTLADPYHAANHPEELVDVSVVGGLRIKMHQTWNPGAPEMALANINLSVSPTAELPIPVQSAQAIALYDNGVRVPQTQVAFDARDSEFTYTGSDTDSVMQAVVWGYGGDGQITGIDYFNGDGVTTEFPFEFDIPVTATQQLVLYVTINGVTNTNFTVNANSSLTFATAPAQGSFIKIAGMIPSTTTTGSGFSIVQVKELDISTLGSETLSGALGTTTDPDIIESIVEIDGLRVMGAGVYEAFITPTNPILELGAVLDINNVTATFNGEPIVIGTDVEQLVTIPASTRSFNLGANWSASDLLVTSGGAPIEVSMITGTAPGYSLSNLNPDSPEINSAITVGWDEDSWDNVSSWDDPTEYMKYVLTPANSDTFTNLVMFQGRLINMLPMTSDLPVEIVYGDTIPNSLAGFTWTNFETAQAIMMGDQFMMLNGVSGDLVVFDAAQAQYTADQAVTTMFPNASRLTVTTFTNPDSFNIHTVTYDHITGDNWFPIPGPYPNNASLWVTLNGKKLVEGTQFYVTSAANGWDIPEWDEDARDEQSPFGVNSLAVRMNEQNGIVAKPGDHVVITVFAAAEATPSYTDITYLDPLREFGFADRMTAITVADQFTLVNDLDQETSDIVITPVLGDGTPDVSTFKLHRSIYHPGLMWVGKELVYFVEATCDEAAQTITLTNVIRGWRGTSQLHHKANVDVFNVTQAQIQPVVFEQQSVTATSTIWNLDTDTWNSSDVWGN
jgi:hypothetical protein